MKINRLCLNNFGILRNQIMEDIHPGLVIIAGPNRAGKTTLMMALRYLGYGLPKRDFIPPPLVGQHDYNADLELADKSRYNIHILGNSKPKLAPLGTAGQLGLEDIFHNLDSFTYRQIFTISLDELRHMPAGLDSGEEERLQVVLLGGGWGDALRLAKLAREFGKRAKDIGGTNGAKNVYDFRPYHEIIQAGIAARNEANKELETYYAKLGELAKLEEEIIPRLGEDLSGARSEREILELVRDHYEQYEEMLLLESKLEQEGDLLKVYPPDGLAQGIELREKYSHCLQEYGEAQRDFTLLTGADKADLLLQNKDVLHSYEKNISGWQERLASYEERMRRHREEERDLQDKLARLYSPWGGELSNLDKIATYGLEGESLRQTLEKKKKAQEGLEHLTLRKLQIQEHLEHKHREKTQFLAGNKPGRKNKLVLLAALSLAAVLLATFFNPLSAVALAFVLGPIIYIQAQALRLREQEYKNQVSLWENDIKGLKEQLLSLGGEEKFHQETLKTCQCRLAEIVTQLCLPTEIPYSQLRDFYREVVNLKERYKPYLVEKERLKELKRELGDLFATIALTLKSLGFRVPKVDGDLWAASEIFLQVEEAITHLSQAQKLERLRAEKENIEKKIRGLLKRENPPREIPPGLSPEELAQRLDAFIGRGQRHRELKKEDESRAALRLNLETSLNIGRRREILGKKEPQLNVLAAYAQYFNTYSSKGKVEMEYKKRTDKIKELEEQRMAAAQRVAVLKKEIEDLSSAKRLQDAQEKIIGAQNSLEALAEEYATQRLAEFLIKEVHRVFTKETKGSVLQRASKLFAAMTAGDYKKIDLPPTPSPGNLVPNFAVKPADRIEPQPTHQLSRATKEQLFLSVRLSRIMAMKPLPVIFDDSLVNFDPNHSRQVARLIAGLVETHQVFVLTCHPAFIECLGHYVPTAQCWGLDRGKIKGPFKDHSQAINFLKHR